MLLLDRSVRFKCTMHSAYALAQARPTVFFVTLMCLNGTVLDVNLACSMKECTISPLVHSKLFRSVYGDTTDSIMSHLWAYRPRITLDHLAQVLPLKEISDAYPILHSFMNEVQIMLECTHLECFI